MGEVRLIRNGQIMAWFSPRVGGGLTIAAHSIVDVTIEPYGDNGVPLAPGVADSASIRFNNPAVVQWVQTGALRGSIVGGEGGGTSMYVDVFRRGERVWTTGRHGVEVR